MEWRGTCSLRARHIYRAKGAQVEKDVIAACCEG